MDNERAVTKYMLEILGESTTSQGAVAQKHHWLFGMCLLINRFGTLPEAISDIERASAMLYYFSRHRLPEAEPKQ